MERLQKVIANSGYTSRRKAEELIKQGRVMVNGVVITEMGYKVNGNDIVLVDGDKIYYEEKEYVLLNKPRNVITSTSDPEGREVITNLIETDKRLYPVGRLDYDTTGAILLTNDGELANILMHPKSMVPKLYIAKVKGFVGTDAIKKLEGGVVIDGYKTSKARARLKRYDKQKDVSMVELTIYEGKNHQVKNMFQVLGFDVLKLKREMFANLYVKNLKSGEYRYLNPKEVKTLYNYKK
jgi:23S rRNA pseudouridine2605 synthase